MNLSRVTATAAVVCTSLAMSSLAEAAFVMTIDDLSTAGVDVVVSDGVGVGILTDSGLVTTAADGGIGPDGFIFFNGGVGSFMVNVVSGVSEPILSTGQMDLNSINVTGAPGTLKISLTDTGFTGNVPSYSANYGGTTTGSVDFNFLQDPTNNEFGGGSFFDPAAVSGGAFSGSGSGAIGVGSPYSLTVIAEIQHTVGSQQISSFDAHLVPVPVPLAVWLFGSGLVGLVGIARRKT
jgi:hypothetical protein